MKIKIENNYADGHESTAIQETQAANGWPAEPPLDHLEEWFEDEGFSYTGDGHTDQKGRSVDAPATRSPSWRQRTRPWSASPTSGPERTLRRKCTGMTAATASPTASN